MKHKEIVTDLLKDEGTGGELMRAYLRASAQYALAEILDEEVESLCGSKHEQGKDRVYRRAGSEKGIMYSNGKKQSIRRPRVRKQTKNGEKEHGLMTYYFARQITNIEDEIIRSVEAGVSTRDQQKLHVEEAISKSEVSRIWANKGSEKLEELRSRQLDHEQWIGLMLDGFVLASDVVAIVALGITVDGEKSILDFVIGFSENKSAAKDLVSRLIHREFKTQGQLLCVLDGSDALRNAVLEPFPDAIIQRCLVHKERNLHGYLSKRHQGECTRLMNRLRKAQGPDSAQEAVNELKRFLKQKNKAAYDSLLEAGEELTAFHQLSAPSTLNQAFLSTNAIENVMRNLRKHLGRVNRWRPDTGQPELWVASGLLNAEKGFRRIKGYKDLPQLISILENQAERNASYNQGDRPPSDELGQSPFSVGRSPVSSI